MMRHEAGRRVDGDGGDPLGRVVRHGLDIHTDYGRNDHRHTSTREIDQHREIVFARDIDHVGDVEPVNLLARIARLDCYQSFAKHHGRGVWEIGEGEWKGRGGENVYS